MIKVYVGHSRQFPYVEELYQPIRNSVLNKKYEFILPHETSQMPYSSLEKVRSFQAMVAEVSSPSTGLGIEMGWFHSMNVPILCLQKEGGKLSQSVQVIATKYEFYKDTADMLRIIEQFLLNLTAK